MWTEGQQVICVDDRFTGPSRRLGDFLPKRWCIYTILSAHWCPDVVTGVYGVGFKLKELNFPGDSVTFSAWRFRRVVEVLGPSLAWEETVI